MNIEEMLNLLPPDYPMPAFGTLVRLMGTDGSQEAIDKIIEDLENDLPFDEIKQENLSRALNAYNNLKLLDK